MFFEIFSAFCIRIMKLIHRNFFVTVFVAILIILVKRKYKLSDMNKELFIIWKEIKSNQQYRHECLLITWSVFMLFCTVFTRSFRNPLENIIGNWLPYNIQFSYVKLDCIENFFLFLPYGFLLNSSKINKIKSITLLVFLTSLTIELFQLITFSGTFQLSDIFYNTIGGIVGKIISKTVYHSKLIS